MKRRTFLQILGLGVVAPSAVADIAEPTFPDGYTFLEEEFESYIDQDAVKSLTEQLVSQLDLEGANRLIEKDGHIYRFYDGYVSVTPLFGEWVKI